MEKTLKIFSPDSGPKCIDSLHSSDTALDVLTTAIKQEKETERIQVRREETKGSFFHIV